MPSRDGFTCSDPSRQAFAPAQRPQELLQEPPRGLRGQPIGPSRGSNLRRPAHSLAGAQRAGRQGSDGNRSTSIPRRTPESPSAQATRSRPGTLPRPWESRIGAEAPGDRPPRAPSGCGFPQEIPNAGRAGPADPQAGAILALPRFVPPRPGSLEGSRRESYAASRPEHGSPSQRNTGRSREPVRRWPTSRSAAAGPPRSRRT